MSDLSPPEWDLSLLYTPESRELKNDLHILNQKREAFVSFRELLDQRAPTPEEFGNLVRQLESISLLTGRLSAFACLWFSENTSDQKASSFLSSMDQLSAEINNDILFFELWWKKLNPEAAGSLRKTLPEYDYFLTNIRAYVEHTLTEPEEKIINLKDVTGREALLSLYDTLTNRYQFDSSFIPEGDGRPLNREQLSVYFRSHKPELRAGAYRSLYRIYSQDGPILGQIYQALVRDFSLENLRLRRYPSPIGVRHKYNDLPQETVASLLRVCQAKSQAIFGRYFHKKAQVLGLPGLRRCDLYAPLAEDKRQWTFEEGLDLVVSCFKDFDPQMGRLALNVAQSRHLDAQIRANKRSGAFCYSLDPQSVPWVMMTYNGRRNDLFTLAHELGHAVHSQLAGANNYFQFQACLPLAETASTFGEMILAAHLKRKARTEDEKLGLSFMMLDDAYATVGRQAFFALFEIKAHELIEAGATVDELSEAYWANLKAQFGQALEIPEDFRWEWVSIPHIFHTPFYVYAYSFGQLLVYSLWRIFEKEGSALTGRLLKLLARGGSAPPLALAAEAGLGPLDDEFWSNGFEVIESFLF